MRPALVAVALALAACTSPIDTPAADAGTCTLPKLCFPGCDEATGTCLKGVPDLVRCACGTPQKPDGGSIDGGLELGVESIALAAPIPAKVALGSPLPIAVLATLIDGSTQDVTGEVTVVATPVDALRSEGPGRWIPTKAGDLSLEVRLEIDGVTKTTTAATRAYPEEARAVWVTRFAYKTAADVQRIVNAAADARFNVVMFQIRGNGDAYYKSTLEPWATALAGQLGKDPGWDPLQVAIDTAHGRGIELHAYFNVFTAWTAGTPPESAAGAPTHALRAHPEWVEQTQAGETTNDSYQWFAPGLKAVRDHNLAVAREILTKYDVDGLHLDRVRYATSAMGWNTLERAAFTESGETSYADWQVHQVDAQVKALYAAVRELRPRAKLSAAVWGIHTPLPGCTWTSKGKADYHQDSWAWAEGGYIDALCPMIYWAEGTGCTDYGDLLATFLAHRGTRDVWSGIHVLDGSTLNWPALSTRIDVTRAQHAQGMTFFASTYMDPTDSHVNGQNVWKLFGDGPFHEEALVPPTRE